MTRKTKQQYQTDKGVPFEGQEILPGVALHRNLAGPSRGWALSHIPSGKSLLLAPTQAILKGAVQYLESHDWTRDEAIIIEDEAARQAIRLAYQHIRKEGDSRGRQRKAK